VAGIPLGLGFFIKNLIQGYLKDPMRIFQRYISEIQQASPAYNLIV
jgi:hypothetical protein